MIYIGIDNGLTGGLVALSDHPGPPIEMIPMPTRNKAKGNEVDAEFVWSFIDKWYKSNTTVILETPGKQGVRFRGKDGQMKQGGGLSLCSMWDSYGAIRGVLESRGIRHHRITPQQWQKVMMPGCAKGDTKPAALAKARQLWPEETWRRTPKCKTPDSGLIDAALIAEYGRIKNL